MEPTASRSSPAGLAPDAGALAAFLDCEADLDALQRCLLAAAVHPAWGGARRAWIAAWDERRALLECERSVELAADPADLLTAIGRARRAAPAPETVAGAPAWRVTPESLEGAAATAWRSGEPASGAGAEQPGAPWCDAEVIAVLPLRRQARPHGLLVLDRDGRAAAPAA